jgi:type I restriction enzyme S subunit
MSSREWKNYLFKEITNNHDKRRKPLASNDRKKMKGKYPYYGAQGIIDYIDDYIFDGTFLLIAEDGENLKSLKQPVAQLAHGKFWVNNHAHILTSNHLSDIRFLYYLFNATDISGYITGSVQPKLSQQNLNAIQLTIPTITEQKAIAATLSCLDDMIELNNRTNQVLEEMAQAVFKHWFVDFEFPNEDGQPYKSSGGKMVDSELGEIPEGWGVGVLADIGDIAGGSTPSKAHPEYYSESDIAWITPKDLSNNNCKFISRGAIDITPVGLRNSSVKILPRGTVLFSSRAPIGYIAIAKNDITTNQGFKSVVPFKNIGTAYIYYFLKENIDLIESRASGSTFKEVSGAVMKQIPVLIPTTKLLNNFIIQCKSIFDYQEMLEDENLVLTATRDTLLPKLMSGEIWVPVEGVV